MGLGLRVFTLCCVVNVSVCRFTFVYVMMNGISTGAMLSFILYTKSLRNKMLLLAHLIFHQRKHLGTR